MAEALQDLITKNAKNNEIEDIESNDQEIRGEQDEQGSDADTVKPVKVTIIDRTIRMKTITVKNSFGISRTHGSHPGAATAKTRRTRKKMMMRSRTRWTGMQEKRGATRPTTPGTKTPRRAMR